jgi:hypothetical protein
MDPITAGINFLGSLITTPEEARAMDLQQKNIETQQKNNELRALEAKNAQAIAALSAKTARETAAIEAAAQQKTALVLAGVAVLGITAFTLVSLTRK